MRGRRVSCSVVAMLAVACRQPMPNSPDTATDPLGVPVLQAEALVVDDHPEVVHVDTFKDALEVTLAPGASLPFARGAVLLGGADGGYLRRVEGIKLRDVGDHQVATVATRQAALGEAFEELHVVAHVDYADTDPRGRTNGPAMVWPLSGIELTLATDAFEATAEVQDGSAFVLQPTVDLVIDVHWGRLERFEVEVGGTAELDARVELTGSGELFGLSREIDLAKLDWPFVVWVGPIPVYAQVETEVNFGAKLDGVVDTGLVAWTDTTLGLSAGFVYDHGESWPVWNPTVSAAGGLDMEPLALGGRFRAYTNVELSVEIYGLAGPFIRPELYLQADAMTDGHTCDLDVVFGHEVQIGAEFELEWFNSDFDVEASFAIPVESVSLLHRSEECVVVGDDPPVDTSPPVDEPVEPSPVDTGDDTGDTTTDPSDTGTQGPDGCPPEGVGFYCDDMNRVLQYCNADGLQYDVIFCSGGCGGPAGDAECQAALPTCADGDGDGYTLRDCGGSDCDDADRLVHPGANEVAGNNVDEDCDGFAAALAVPRHNVCYTGGGALASGELALETADQHYWTGRPAATAVYGATSICAELDVWGGEPVKVNAHVVQRATGASLWAADLNGTNAAWSGTLTVDGATVAAVPFSWGTGADAWFVMPSGPGRLDTDGDGSADADDCAPRDADVAPGLPEVPGNGVDDDCRYGDAAPGVRNVQVCWSAGWAIADGALFIDAPLASRWANNPADVAANGDAWMCASIPAESGQTVKINGWFDGGYGAGTEWMAYNSGEFIGWKGLLVVDGVPVDARTGPWSDEMWATSPSATGGDAWFQVP